jgi:hypothetical protein
VYQRSPLSLPIDDSNHQNATQFFENGIGKEDNFKLISESHDVVSGDESMLFGQLLNIEKEVKFMLSGKSMSSESLDVKTEDEFILSDQIHSEMTKLPKVYDLDHVNDLRAMCSHIQPEDWNTSSQYNPGLVRIYQAYLDFLDDANIELLRLVPGALRYLIHRTNQIFDYVPWSCII